MLSGCPKVSTEQQHIKSFSGVQGAVFQKSPLAAGGTINKLYVIIPTYNRKTYLARLLAQVQNQELPGSPKVEMTIVVVVDGSTDGTMEMLAAGYPDVEVIKGDGNWWWTKSVNEGCKFALQKGAEAVLLMNDDTEIREHYVESLLKKAGQQPGAIIGSLNITADPPHKIYFSGAPRITWWKAKTARYHPLFAPNDERLTGLHKSILLMGRGMLIPASVFARIGFLDEKSFPQYKADLDFVLTANENNIPTYISWDSIIYSHLELTGKGVTYKKQSLGAFLKSFFQKNSMTNLLHSFRYYRKHCPLYLLPLSFLIDKLRLIYSFLRVLFASGGQKPFREKVSGLPKAFDKIKNVVKREPLLRKPAYFLAHLLSGPFQGSERYWEERYAGGGHSGPGSTQHLAAFKAEILNAFVRAHQIKTVIEYGSGDGQQLELAEYLYYIGFDVSPTAIAVCKEKFKGDKTREFKSMSEYNGERAELTLSLDVIYHLVEDEVYHRYMERLFSSSDGYVIIYSSDTDENVPDQPKHIRHRKFSQWIEKNAADWELIEHIPNKYPYDPKTGQGSFADFYIYIASGGSAARTPYKGALLKNRPWTPQNFS